MRILFLTHRLPYAPNRGDRVRAYHELRVLARRHEVHLVSLVHDNDEAAHAGDLAGMAASTSVIRVTRLRNLVRGALMLPTRRPLTHLLLDGPGARSILDAVTSRTSPDLVFAFCSGMARFALEPPLASLPFVLDMVDVDSAKWQALAETALSPKRLVFRREAHVLRHFEAAAARSARMTWVVNSRELVLLQGVAGREVVAQTLQNGVDTVALAPARPAADSEDVVFCGVMDYPPNAQGAVWLATEVWSRVKRARPRARLLLVGANPTRQLRLLAERDRSVVVTGTVPDVRPYLWGAAVSAAPLRVARGVQNKVLEAVASGLPAVITRAVADGLPPEVMPACDVVDTPDAFASAIVSQLATQPDARRRRAERAQLSEISWDARLLPMLATLEAIAACPRL